MIRSAVKNYFKQFKYVFSGMGVVYLAMLIVLFALFFGAGRILSDAVGASVTELGEFLSQNLTNVTLERLFEPGFFPEFFRGILSIFNAAGENVVAEFAALATGLLSFFLLSLKLASYLMRRLIRGDLRDGETKRGLLVLVFRYLATLLFAAAAAVLTYFWIYSAVLLLLAFAVLKAFEQLFTTWFVYCKKSFRLKEMFRVKYVLQILAANFVSIAVNLLVILLLAAIVNVFFALLLAIPLVVYSFTVIDFTTVDYFNRLKQKPPEEAAPTRRAIGAKTGKSASSSANTARRETPARFPAPSDETEALDALPKNPGAPATDREEAAPAKLKNAPADAPETESQADETALSPNEDAAKLNENKHLPTETPADRAALQAKRERGKGKKVSETEANSDKIILPAPKSATYGATAKPERGRRNKKKETGTATKPNRE